MKPIFYLSIMVCVMLAFLSCKQEIKQENLSDNTPPSITSVFPKNGSIDVTVDCCITATFVEPIALSSLNSKAFSAIQDGTLVSGVYRVEGNSAVFTPINDFQKEKTITVTLSGDISDTTGNRFPRSYSWSFEPTRHPTVVSTSPGDEALNVAVNSLFTAVFSEAMAPDSINTSTFTLSDGSNTVSGSVSYSELTATFEPGSPLSEWTDYTATVTTGVRDLASNAMQSDYSWSFKTDDTTAPEMVSIFPADNAAEIAIDTSISVTFSEPIDPATVTTNTADTSCSGSLQLSADSFATCVRMSPDDPVSGSGDTVFTITTASNLHDDATYSLRLTTGVTDISGFNSLVAETFSQFTTVDLTPPQIVSVSPADSSENNAINTVITAIFDEAMNPDTINTDTFTLADGTADISGAVSYSGVTAKFSPDTNLSEWTNYTATVTTGARDLAGNAMQSDYSWSFKTDDTTAPEVVTTSPADNAIEVAVNTSITVTFSEPIDPATVTTNTSDTSCFGSIQLSADNFTTCVQMSTGDPTHDSENMIFYLTPASDINSTTTYAFKITQSITDNNNNGLLEEIISEFTTKDETPPQVESFNPANGSTNIVVNTDVKAVFNEDMNPSTITTSTFTLKDGAVPVSGSVSYSGKTATFTPDVYLNVSTTYTATITTGVEDLAGNALSADSTSNFTTAPAIIDSVTGLMWQDNGYETTHTWSSALSYCNGLPLANFSDWRLPTKDELIGLYNRRSILSSYATSDYWSATEVNASDAYLIDFGSGSEDQFAKSFDYFVRCIR
jgi:methionine-rich copper-binding protein CopC